MDAYRSRSERVPVRLLVLVGVLVHGVGCGGTDAPRPAPPGPAGSSTPPAAVPAPDAPSAVEVAVTIDDLPFASGLAPGDDLAGATDRILAALREHRAPATGFVVCDPSRGDDAVLRTWIDRGFALGNHTSTHRHLDDLDLATWEADVARCQSRIETVTGERPRYFRFPFLQTGATVERRDAAAEVLRRLGHEVAPVSIDTQEWLLVTPFLEALRAGDSVRAEAIASAWVDHVVDAFRHYREVAVERTGGGVRHVLLLHANALCAERLSVLLGALADLGARFVTLEQALADPVYALPDDYAGGWGVSWLYRFQPLLDGAWSWDEDARRALEARFGLRPAW